MCEFFSALVLRNGDLIHDAATDSHTDLVDAFGLDKVENTGCQHFAKIEFTPSSKETMDEIDTYTLRVDESTEPIWFSEVKDIVIQKCRSIVSRMIIIGEHKCILSGKYILGKNANVRKVVNSNIIAMLGSSQVGEMWGSSQVGVMMESSQVGVMMGSSQVGVMMGSSQVGVMRKSSQVGKMWGSSQVGVMWGSSQVGVMWGSSQVGVMMGSSQVGVMRESSQVGEMWGSSQVGVMRESSQVGEMWGSSQVGVMMGSSQVQNDNRVKTS